MGNVVLLGDSIFDNAVYVPGGASVTQQLQERLPAEWRATLLAVDGDVTSDVAGQLTGLPAEATHLVVSIGGNDALGYSSVLEQFAGTTAEVLNRLHDIQADFQAKYDAMLERVLSHGKPTAVCTIYDQIPFPDAGRQRLVYTALAIFNDSIIRAAVKNHLPVIDLRSICSQPHDYSELSPIEPSEAGGAKIADAIAAALQDNDFDCGRTTIRG